MQYKITFYILMALSLLFKESTQKKSQSGQLFYGKEILLDINKYKDLRLSKNSDTGIFYKLVFNNSEANFNIIENLDNDAEQGYSITKNLGGGKGLL